MRYCGHHVVFVIDGLDGIDACYYFAAITKMGPRGFTLQRLWRLAEAVQRHRRQELLEQASLVWNLSDIDTYEYLIYGDMTSTGRGGPVQMDAELEKKVAEQINKIRQENPDLPTGAS